MVESQEEQKRKSRVTINNAIFDNVKRLYENGLKPKIISELGDLSISSVYTIIAAIEEGATNFSQISKKAGRKNKDYSGIKQLILGYITEDNSLTQVGIQTKLEESGHLISKSKICILMKELCLGRKRLKKICEKVLDEEHEVKVRRYAFEMVRRRDMNFLFLDESGFNLHTSINYGYALPGTSPVKYQPASPGQNLSLCCIISNVGIVGSKLVDGGFSSNTFCEFLEEINDRIPNNSILILDNASIHHSQQTKLQMSRLGIEVMYLPTYSPDFNPIENFFSALKARLNQTRPRPQVRGELRDALLNALNTFENEPELFENLYSNMWKKIRDILSNTQ